MLGSSRNSECGSCTTKPDRLRALHARGCARRCSARSRPCGWRPRWRSRASAETYALAVQHAADGAAGDAGLARRRRAPSRACGGAGGGHHAITVARAVGLTSGPTLCLLCARSQTLNAAVIAPDLCTFTERCVHVHTQRSAHDDDHRRHPTAGRTGHPAPRSRTTASPSAATTTPSSGAATSGPRTSRLMQRGRRRPRRDQHLRLVAPRAARRASTTSRDLDDDHRTCCTPHGIRVNLGTGTASPPPWLTTLHPEILPVADDGTTRYPGGRQAWCPSSPVFRERALAPGRAGRRPLRRPPRASRSGTCPTSSAATTRSATATTAPPRSARWLEPTLRRASTALNDAWGTIVLEPALQRLRRDPAPAAHALHAQPRPGARLPPVQLRRAARLLPRRDGRAARAQRRARHDELHGHRAHPQPRLLVAGRRTSTSSPTTTTSTTASPTRPPSSRSPPTSPAASPAATPWLLMEHSTGAVNWQPLNLAKDAGGDDCATR